MNKATWAAGLAATALTATVLISGGGPGSVTPPVAAATGLVAFDGCDDVAEWYRTAALKEVTAWGLGGGYSGLVPVTAMAGVEERTTPTDAVANGGTGTNVQEAGVDEPDIAKTDGSRTYVVDGRDLVVSDVTGSQPVELGRLKLSGELRGAELLLVGDRVVLFSTAWGTQPSLPRGSLVIDSAYLPGPATTVMAVVDAAEPSAMSVLSEREIEGELVASREHEGTVRVVVRSTPAFDFVYPGPRAHAWRSEQPHDKGLTSAEALTKNRQLIRRASAAAFLPRMRVDGGRFEPLLRCEDVTHPRSVSGLGTVSVLTLDPEDPDALKSTAVSANGDQVYASADRLYVATTAGGWWGQGVAGRLGITRTEVHAFDVSGSSTSYVASGDVPGYAPDRWSFSEHDGLLRVATTEQKAWRDAETTVTVLREVGTKLNEVGSVSGLGLGEQIQSVRWFDDLAIVVTFEQTDPLYTIDLSDPAAPAVLGELKIPGFSAYLHPLGNDLLLGIGQDATGTGRTTGSQASSFDISDLAMPTRLTALGLGAHRYSPVEEDSRSFSYLPEQRIALVPVTDWRRSGTRLAAVRVGEDGKLTHAGSLDVGPGVYGLRALPLSDGRVAVVAGGAVVELTRPGQLAAAGS